MDIQRLPTSRVFEEWERDLLHAIPEFLLNYTRYRNWFEQSSKEDLEAILGEAFATLAEADSAAMAAIGESDGKTDQAWVQALHRRSLRLSMIMAGTDPDSANPLFHRLDPILPG